MVKKNIKGFLVVDWKKNTVRFLKRFTLRTTGTWEIPIKVDIDLVLPEHKEIEFRATIEVPKAKAMEMVAEAI